MKKLICWRGEGSGPAKAGAYRKIRRIPSGCYNRKRPGTLNVPVQNLQVTAKQKGLT